MTTTTAGAAGVTLTRAQLGVILNALDDAITDHMEYLDATCADCVTSPAGECADHAAAADALDGYRRLRSVLEVSQP